MNLAPETYVREVGVEDGLWQKAEALGLVAMSAQAGPRWGDVKRDHCVRPGFRQVSSILWDIPGGQRWQDVAARTPITIDGILYLSPHRTPINTHQWGEWDVPDGGCARPEDINAVVFALPNEPINLGHMAWGIKLGADDWFYGGTELSLADIGLDLKVEPKEWNGVWTERGTKAKMFERFATGSRPSGHWHVYPIYKPLVASFPLAQAGLSMAQATAGLGYWVNGNNCMNHVVRVLNAYSAIPLVPQPEKSPLLWAPNLWFTAVNAPAYHTSKPF